MNCETVRKGSECSFMTAKGCSYTNGFCMAIVEKCNGCNRVVEYENAFYCTATPNPASKWKLGRCNLATHVHDVVETKKEKVNPLKASKRAATKK